MSSARHLWSNPPTTPKQEKSIQIRVAHWSFLPRYISFQSGAFLLPLHSSQIPPRSCTTRGFWTYFPKKPGAQVFSFPFSSVLWTGLFKKPPCILDKWVTSRSHPLLSQPFTWSLYKGEITSLMEVERGCQAWEDTNMLFSGRLGAFLKEQGSRPGAEGSSAFSNLHLQPSLFRIRGQKAGWWPL